MKKLVLFWRCCFRTYTFPFPEPTQRRPEGVPRYRETERRAASEQRLALRTRCQT